MIRNIFLVMRGTVLAQLIGFLALPYLARLFEPAAFGHYQLFISLVTLALVLPTLRYEIALLRVEDGREYRDLVRLCLGLALAVTAVAAIIVAAIELSDWRKILADVPFSPWLVVVAMLIGGLAQVLNLAATREKGFPAIANSKIVQSLVYVAVAIAIGLAATSQIGLIFADIAGRVALLLVLVFWARSGIPDIRGKIEWAPLRQLAHKYREYPYVSTPGTMINVAGGFLTPIMIYATFSASSSGQYGLLERSVGLPLSLVIIAVGQVFTAEFSHNLRTNTAAAFASFKSLVGVMLLLALFPLIVLLMAGPFLFALVFGEQWRVAGELSQLMAPAFASMLLSGPIHMVLTVLGFQKTQTAWEISRLALVVGLWAMVPLFGIGLKTAVACYSAIVVLCNLSFVALAFATLRRASANEMGTEKELAR